MGRPNYSALTDITSTYLAAVKSTSAKYSLPNNGWLVGVHIGNYTRSLIVNYGSSGYKIVAGNRMNDEYWYQNMVPVNAGDKIYVASGDDQNNATVYTASDIHMKIYFIPEQ